MIFIILIDINSTYLSWQIIIKPIEEGKLSEKQKAQVLPIYSSIFCKAVPTELLAKTVLIASCELRRVTRGEGSLPPDRLLTSAEKKKTVAFTDSPPQTMLYCLPDASPWEPTAWCEMILPGSRQPCLGWALDFQENDTNSVCRRSKPWVWRKANLCARYQIRMEQQRLRSSRWGLSHLKRHYSTKRGHKWPMQKAANCLARRSRRTFTRWLSCPGSMSKAS